MRNCCVAAFVAVHNNALGAYCQMRVMQSPVRDPRKGANRAGLRLASPGPLPHSPAPMHTSDAQRPRFRRGTTPAHPFLGWLLLGLGATALAQQPDLGAAGAAIATGSDLLETEIVVEKLEPADPPSRPQGRFVPAGRLEAGDEVHYTIRVRNPGQNPVTGAQVTKRMPFGLHYIEGSATGPASDVEFSTDGGKSFTAGPQDGDYTHLRWTLRRPLPPQSTALLRFRATFR